MHTQNGMKRTQLARALDFFSNFNPFLCFDEKRFLKKTLKKQRMTVLSTFEELSYTQSLYYTKSQTILSDSCDSFRSDALNTFFDL